MGKILYVFPHPDDESFGPGPAIAKQVREGHEVFLLSLTRGEATRERFKFGYSREEMGRIRYEEMQEVARILGLQDLTVLEYADGSLAALDPLNLETTVREHIGRTAPDALVTYTTHGISGHLDHLVTHAVVKRVFCELRRAGGAAPRRLALFCLPEETDVARPAHLKGTPADEIDCIVQFDGEDLRRGGRALKAYKTYADVVEEHQPLQSVRDGVCFALFQEHFQPPIGDLLDRLP